MTAFAPIGLDSQLAVNNDDDDRREPKRSVADINWNDPDDVADLAQFLWDNRDYKRRIEEQAIRNISYVVGDQFRKLNRRTMQMEADSNRPRWEIQIAYNRILPALQQKLARLLRVDTEWGASPTTDDEADKVVARLQKRVASYYYTHKLKMTERLSKSLLWAMMTKVSFLECNWNPFDGEKIIVTPDQMDMPDPQTGQPIPGTGVQQFLQQFGDAALQRGFKAQFTGDVNVEEFPLFEMIVWPFNALEWDHVRLWMRTRLRTIAEAARLAGVEPSELKTSSPMSTGDDRPYQDRLTQAWGYHTSTELSSVRTQSNLASGYRSEEEMVYCHDLYLDPRYDPERYPDGMTALVVGDQTIEHTVGPIPFPNKRPPYFVVQEQPVPGTLYGTCTVDQMRAGQDDLNDTVSSMANARRRSIHPTIIHFGGFLGPKRQFNNAPGQVLRVRSPEHVPVVLQRPPLPNDYERCIAVATRFLDEVSGTADVDRGRTDTTRASSGVAIRALQEKNDSRIGPLAKTARNTSYEIGEFCMELLQEFAVDERILEIDGENNRSEVIVFSREKLRPSTFGRQGRRRAMIRVTGDGGLPTNKADLIQYIDLFTRSGYLQPGRDDALVMKSIGVGEFSEFFDRSREDSADETNAIEMFKEGQVPSTPRQTASFDQRLRILGNWINTQEYIDTIKRMPQLAQIIADRLQMLKQGSYDHAVEQQYLQLSADLRMYQKYLARWLKASQQGQVDIQLVQAMFGVPLSLRGAFGGAVPPPPGGPGNGQGGPNPGQKKGGSELPPSMPGQPERRAPGDNPGEQNATQRGSGQAMPQSKESVVGS